MNATISLETINIICWVLIALVCVATLYSVFKIIYDVVSNYNRIKKNSKYILDIEFEEGKLDKEIYDNALSLVSTLYQRNIFDVSIEPCGEDELSINIKKYLVYISLTKESIEGYIVFNTEPKNHIKFILNLDKPTWQHDTIEIIDRAITMKERK
jgi:hypothetical protein